LLNWFEKKQSGGASASATTPTGPKVPRHSGGWSVLRKRLQAEPGLRVIDVGYTSPTNINFLTEMGHSIFLADLVQDAWNKDWHTEKDEEGNPKWDVEGFLNQSLNFGGRSFDVVLLWTALDYLPEAFVVPVVMRLSEAMNPGGDVLAFFHTRTHGEETAHCRFHLTPTDDVEVQLSQSAPIQRAFTNRSIERLFAGWSGHRQFLAKDSVSEVIMTR
jgi:hypothetical protein